MLNISGFLEKFLKLDKSNKQLRQALLSTIKEITGVELKNEDLDLKEETVYLKCSPIFRNQIFMHKEAIEGRLKEQKVFLKIL